MNLHIFLLFLTPISAYKVLVYNPRFAYAHTKFMGAVSDALVDAGLDVTVLLNDHDDRHNLNGTTKAKIIFVPACSEAAEAIRRQTDHEFCKVIWGVSATNPLVIPGLKVVMEEVTVPQCQYLLAREDILERLKNEKFDVGVTEAFSSCGVGLFEAVGIKATVVGSSMSIFESISTAVGVPLFPSFTPGTYAQGTDSMSFWGRLENLVHIGTSWDMMRYVERKEHETFVEKYGKDFPTMDELYKKAQLVFTNSIPYLDFPRLTYHKILDIGGITYEKPKPLNEKWQSLLSKGPAVLISFGSVAKSIHMPEDYKLSVIETIKRFPNITFIWKHEEPIDPRLLRIENIFASNWIPQNDLLGHENITLFITHGGANSVSESAFLGKPMIVVPVFADQTRMGNMAQERGIGILLTKEQLGEKEVLYNAINRLLYAEEFELSYPHTNFSFRIKTACQRFLSLRAAVNYNPGKVLADHVKLLAEFKTLKELQPKAAELNTFVLYGLDVALFLSIVIIALLVIASLVLRRIVSFFLSLLLSKKKLD